MTARFLALYEKPADPEAFDRHYREIHIPLGHRHPCRSRGLVADRAWLEVRGQAARADQTAEFAAWVEPRPGERPTAQASLEGCPAAELLVFVDRFRMLKVS